VSEKACTQGKSRILVSLAPVPSRFAGVDTNSISATGDAAVADIFPGRCAKFEGFYSGKSNKGSWWAAFPCCEPIINLQSAHTTRKACT
jgi:hypothetical protein